jgi:signal transduction histidine kinase
MLPNPLCAPLIWAGEIIGVINFRSKSASAYNDDSLQIANQISTVAASILGRSKMAMARTQADHQRATITSISNSVTQAVDVRRIFDSIALQIDEIIPIDRIVLNSLNSDRTGYSVEASWGPADELMRHGIFKALTGTATEMAVTAGVPIILSKNQIENISVHNRPEGDDPAPMKSWIAVPLKLRGEAIGVMHFRTFDPNAYDRSHLDYAQQLAAIFTTTIENYSHSRDNERERQIRNSVVKLNRRAIEGDSLDVLADTAGNLLSQFIDYDRFSAVAIDIEKSQTTVLYQTGTNVPGGGSNSKMAYSGMAESGTSQLGDIDDLAAPWRDRLKEAGLQSWMYMAIGGESGNPIGAIWISSKKKSAFNGRDLEIVERLGGVLAPVFHANALEQAREQLEGERERSQSLATQTAILESDARAKSEFISSISHEFKTPLTSVVAFSSLLRRDDSMSERQHKQLDLIQNNAWRLEKMIDDLLHVASADAGRLTFDVQEVNVAAMAREVCDGIIPVAKAAGKRLVWRSSNVEASAAVDPVRYAQAVQNIVSNAVKYSPSGTGITASICEIDGGIELLVRNKGNLSRTESEQAFNRFTRLDNEVTRSTPGTGLGLSITREILDEMGGTISLESNGHCIEARIRVPVFTK